MATSTLDRSMSLVECLNAHTPLMLSRSSCPDDVHERRYYSRYKPSDRVTVRLDVLGGIWSATIEDISARSALVQLDHEIAEQIEDGQSASIWLESSEGSPMRFDGRLRSFRNSAGLAPDQPAPLSFICDMASLPAADVACTFSS